MSENVPSLFDNKSLPAELQAQLDELTKLNDKLGGSSFTTRRISIRGGKFRQIVNGVQAKISRKDTMNIIVVDAAPISRQYYDGPYDPEKTSAPDCWSPDGETPDAGVKEPQCATCKDCPQNIKGSGQGESRACRFAQRLAVVTPGNLKEVHQLQLAATSIFGDGKENELPMGAYAKFLKGHNTPACAVVTEMRFDEESDVPKLYFRAVEPLTPEQLTEVLALRGTEDVERAITFTVFETDDNKQQTDEGDTSGPEDSKTPTTLSAEPDKVEPKVEDAADDKKSDTVAEAEWEEVDEPEVKGGGKEEVQEPEDGDKKLASILDEWDD